jgi:hypothetical protein
MNVPKEQRDAVLNAATAIALSKLRAIGQRLSVSGKEPTTEEARFAASFSNSVPLPTLLRWLEGLRNAMECDADEEKVALFIRNLQK